MSLKLKDTTYSYCRNVDGSTRPMTEAEQKAFKPTHVTTYGENAAGQFCAYTTDLATNETTTDILSPIEWKPSDWDVWMKTPENKV